MLWTSLFPLEWLIPHFVHSEWSHVASIVARSVGLVILGSSWNWTFVIVASHVGRWTTLELTLSERDMRLETTVVVPIVHWTSVLWTTVVIHEAIRVRMIHHLAITTSSQWLLVVGVEVLRVLRTLVEASPAIISVSVIIASWSRLSIMVLILR